FHSCRLDGLQPSRAAICDGWDYIEGRRTLDEIIEDVVRRHTRGSHGR
ncbi:antitoxin VbhA family protein, partial [Salmonella enterica subsp. enterica serovar Typhimurium]|nr:antitoxin VbhA family protein [Salmonella enterica subsp. enterica serovar Typhimurium]